MKQGVAQRFVNDYTCLEHFNELVLIKCPRCQRCAEIVRRNSQQASRKLSVERQANCRHCGYATAYESSTFDMACITDDWPRRLPLWLQVPCCGKVLWAFNIEHLSFLERFVAAELRERAKGDGHSNHSLSSRLPQWMQSAKHRGEVLRGLQRLRERLPSG